MICGDAREFMENVSGKYDSERGFCIRIDIAPQVFQLVQGEMVSDFGIVMLRNFNGGVELPAEFCIMVKSEDQSPVQELETASSDEGEEGWYNEFDTTTQHPEAPTTGLQEAPPPGTAPTEESTVKVTQPTDAPVESL